MFKDLTPIQKLDAVLTFMAKTQMIDMPVNPIKKEFEITKQKPVLEILGKLEKEGYIDNKGYDESLGSHLYSISFDGRLFESLGGYKAQQKEIEQQRITNAQNETRIRTNEKHLLWATWFAGIAAALVLLWYIFVYFYPPHSECDFFYH